MICRHRLLLIVRVLAVLTYFLVGYFPLHVLLLVYCAFAPLCGVYYFWLMHCFLRCRTSCDWFLALEFRFYRPRRG